MPGSADQPTGPDPFAALRRKAYPDTEHSVRLEADPGGSDVMLQIDFQWINGGKLCGYKQDMGAMRIGAVRLDRERDAAGRVSRIRISCELAEPPAGLR